MSLSCLKINPPSVAKCPDWSEVTTSIGPSVARPCCPTRCAWRLVGIARGAKHELVVGVGGRPAPIAVEPVLLAVAP